MRERRVDIDLLRIVAAFAVSSFHIMVSCVTHTPDLSQQTGLIVTSVASTLKWHVPVFFMITGYLWLNNNKVCTWAKMWHNIVRFVLALFVFGTGYAMLERIFLTKTITAETFLLAIGDVFTANLWDHMWYLYTIIGIYLLLPIFKPFFSSSSIREISLFTGLLFFFTVLEPTIKDVIGYDFPIYYLSSSSLLYVCVGGLLSRIKISKKYGFLSLISLVLSSAIIFWISCNATVIPDISSIFIFVSAISIFYMIAAFFSEVKSSYWIRQISDCTFGIYLIHPFFINVLIKVFHIYLLKYYPPVSLTVASFFVFGLSFVVVYFLRKISFVRKFIL